MGRGLALQVLLLGTLIMLVGCGGGSQNVSNPGTPTPATPSLAAIVVNPPSAQISKGSTQQFTATGKYSDGSTKDLTDTVQWSSSQAAVASVSVAGVAWAGQTGSATIIASSGALHGSASLNVTAAPLISISITPGSASLAAGTALQLKAIGIFQDGSTQDLTTSAAWSTSAPAVASVSGSGLIVGAKAGTTQVVASQGPISGSENLTVTAATLVSLAISPGSASVAQGTDQQFSLIGKFTDGSTQDLTAGSVWSSSLPTVATVRAGLASGVAAGSTIITATSGSLSASAHLTVTSATVVSVAVSPVNPTLVVGVFKQFTATGTFSDGSTQDISGVVAWTSSAPSVASTNNAGLVSGMSAGTAVISAAFEQVPGSSTISVHAPSLVSISVTPGTPSIANTTTQAFAVNGYYDDGSTQTLNSASWSSSNPAVASMNGNVALALQPGTTTITAVFGSFTASTTLTVTSATLVSLAVIPANRSMAPGTTKTYFAVGSFSDGSTQYVSNLASWSASNPSIAKMNGNLATAVGSGTTSITASFDSVAGSTGLTVTQASLTSLTISPSNPVLVLGGTQQFAVTGTFSDGSTQDMTLLVTWNSSALGVANIGVAGLATAQGAGTTTISASYGSVSASTTLTVSSATLVSLSVTPANASIPPGSPQQFSAIGTYSDGTMQNLTNMAHWTSSNSTVATVGNAGSSGQASGLSAGWTRISAVLNSTIASAVLNVNSATLVSLAVTPADPTLTLGSNQQLTAIGTFSDGSTQNMTAWVNWTSSNAQVCVVNSSGYAITSGSGTATITASFGSVSTTTTVTVY